MSEKNIIKPVQPYLLMDAEDYREIFPKRMGIANFYEFNMQSEQAKDFLAVPDSSTDLVFGIGENDVKVYLGGTVLKAKDWSFEGGRYYFGARFLPGRYILPKNLTIHDIVNNDLELDANEYGAGLTEQLAEAVNVSRRAEILMGYLEKSQRDDGKDSVHRLEEYMRKRIYATGGNISIQMLSRETGYSECYIRRIFKDIHGISPKEFERFIRFQTFLNEISEASIKTESEEVALSCGYYDQSHMLKDFRTFAGTTPEKYKKLLNEKRKEKDSKNK